MEVKKSHKLVLIFILSCLNVYFTQLLFAQNRPYVLFANVGEGDAELVRTKYNQVVLIDGGPNAKILEVLGRRLPYWQRTIDLLILTHPHSDHISGQIEVLKRYDVDLVLWNGIGSDSAEFHEWESLIKQKGIKRLVIKRGSRIVLNEANKMLVLWPDGRDFSQKEINDSSLIIKLDTSADDFLFTGDVSASVLEKLGGDIRAEVLKVPHHGSKSGLNVEVIDKIKPQKAVIEVGKNSYGHPSKEIIGLLRSFGATVILTQEGWVELPL